MSQFEVRCDSCDVSFPPEKKTCFFCGARLGSGLLARSGFGRTDPSPIPEFEFQPNDPGHESPIPFDLQREEEAEVEEETAPRGVIPRLLSSLAWVFLFIGISIYRACTDS